MAQLIVRSQRWSGLRSQAKIAPSRKPARQFGPWVKNSWLRC